MIENNWPEFHPFPLLDKAKRLAGFLFNQLQHEGLSSHIRGAEAMLSRELDAEQMELPFVLSSVYRATHDNRWDDMGRYL